MEIFSKILLMFGIAFAISMFVASVIWFLNWILSDSNFIFSFLRKYKASKKIE